MNIKDLLSWSWQHKYWCVISLVLCIGLGVVYFWVTPKKRSVSASIMLLTPNLQSQQGEMMSLMGVDGSKSASDEIEVLTSRDLMEQIVDSLHLTMEVACRHHGRWQPIYPYPKFTLEYDQPVLHKKVFKVRHDGETYRIKLYPRIAAVDIQLSRVSVKRLSRESQVIVLSETSSNPQQTVAILNMLIDLYNDMSAKDRNAIALQSQTFLNEHLSTVQHNLNQAETELEQYKRDFRIIDIETTALDYQKQIEESELQIADIELKLQLLEDLEQQLRDTLVCRNFYMIYGDFHDATINAVISTFNSHVIERTSLLASATENNPKVKALDLIMEQQRSNIARGCEQSRNVLSLQKKHITQLYNKYTFDLAQLPEQERTYIEMQRKVQMLEEQYLYLIRKSEENNLILASSSLPTKVIDRAKMAAKISSPTILKTIAGSVILGLLLPLLVYFFGVFKKEFITFH